MNKRLALVNRARMSTLNAIRRFGDTDAVAHLQSGLKWLNGAMEALRTDPNARIDILLINAVTHLQIASRTLGFDPVKIERGLV